MQYSVYVRERKCPALRDHGKILKITKTGCRYNMVTGSPVCTNLNQSGFGIMNLSRNRKRNLLMIVKPYLGFAMPWLNL